MSQACSVPRRGKWLLLLGTVVLVGVALAPDFSHRFLANDLVEGSPRSINRALRHLGGETRLDADDRLLPFLAHEDKRTRERVLRHVSRLNSPATPVAVLEGMKAGHLEEKDALEAIRRIRNPLAREPIEAWLAENDGDGAIREALAEHLGRLAAEEERWGAPPYTRAVIDAQVSAMEEGEP